MHAKSTGQMEQWQQAVANTLPMAEEDHTLGS